MPASCGRNERATNNSVILQGQNAHSFPALVAQGSIAGDAAHYDPSYPGRGKGENAALVGSCLPARNRRHCESVSIHGHRERRAPNAGDAGVELINRRSIGWRNSQIRGNICRHAITAAIRTIAIVCGIKPLHELCNLHQLSARHPRVAHAPRNWYRLAEPLRRELQRWLS